MEIFTWTTNPYDLKNYATNLSLIKNLNNKKNFNVLNSTANRVGFGLVQYLYHVTVVDSEIVKTVNEQINKLNYIPLTLTSEQTNLYQIYQYREIVKHLVENVFHVKVESVEFTQYEDYVSYRPYYYVDEISLPVSIYVHPDTVGDYMLRCSPTPFKNMTYLNSHDLVWLALDNLQKQQPGLFNDFEYIEKEGVVAIKNPNPQLVIEVDTLVEKYKDLNVKPYKLSDKSLVDADIISELSDMWGFDIWGTYSFDHPVIYYSFPENREYYFDLTDAVSEIKRENLPKIYFTGDFALSVEPLILYRQLLKYAALRAYTQLTDINPALSASIIYVDVLPDITIIAPLTTKEEAETFNNLVKQYLQLTRYWSYFGVESAFEGLLNRWKIMISYQYLTPIVVDIDGKLVLVVDTNQNMGNFELAPIEEEDKNYLKMELYQYYKQCTNDILAEGKLSLEQLFSLVRVKSNELTYCYPRDVAIAGSNSLAPYNEKLAFNPFYAKYGFYGLYGVPFVGGLLYQIEDTPTIKPLSGKITIEDDEDNQNAVLIDDQLFFFAESKQPEKLQNVVSKLYEEGKFFTSWGGSYMLYRNQLSRAGLIGNKFLTNANKQTLEFLESI